MEERVISLRKNGTRTISLRKNQEKEGENFDYVYCGLRWAQAVIKGRRTGRSTHMERKVVYTGNFLQKLFKSGPSEIVETEVVDNPGHFIPDTQLDIDLDASVVMFDEKKKQYDIVYYGHQTSNDGSVASLLGDDLTGTNANKKGAEGDNELIRIELGKVSPNVKYMTVILNIYQHLGRDEKALVFDHIPSATMNIYSSDMKVSDSKKINQLKTFAEYQIDNNPDFIGKKALVLGTFIRTGEGNSWKFTASGEMTTEKSIQDMIKGSVKKALKEL